MIAFFGLDRDWSRSRLVAVEIVALLKVVDDLSRMLNLYIHQKGLLLRTFEGNARVGQVAAQLMETEPT